MGRFMQPDWSEDPEPVPYAEFEDPQSLNLYSYVENNPTSSTDGDGHVCTTDPDTGDTKCIVKEKLPPKEATPASTLPLPMPFLWDAEEGIGRLFGVAARGASVPVFVLGYLISPPGKFAKDTIDPTPTNAPLPSGLVGTQDGKSGQQGERHNSGPLDPSHGGSGNADIDFDTLTGGKNVPAGPRYPPGTKKGDNGITLRPPRGNSGPRIDIPANGSKPHETLHYPWS